MKKAVAILAPLLALVLAGCVTPPPQSAGTYPVRQTAAEAPPEHGRNKPPHRERKRRPRRELRERQPRSPAFNRH
jgi:hypothetical protein